MDPLGELDEQDQDLVWQYREYLSQLSQSLPKLLRSVKWNSRDAVAQMLQVRVTGRHLEGAREKRALPAMWALGGLN